MSGCWILLSLFISYNFQRNAKLEERASKIEVYHVRTSFFEFATLLWSLRIFIYRSVGLMWNLFWDFNPTGFPILTYFEALCGVV